MNGDGRWKEKEGRRKGRGKLVVTKEYFSRAQNQCNTRALPTQQKVSK